MRMTSIYLVFFPTSNIPSEFWPSDRQLFFVSRALYDFKGPTYAAREIKEPTPYTTLVSNVSNHLNKLAATEKSLLGNSIKRQIRIVNTSKHEGLHWIVSDITYGQTTMVDLHDPYGNTRLSTKIVTALRKIKVPANLKLEIKLKSLGLQDNTGDTSKCGIISTFIQLVLVIEGTIDIEKIILPTGWDEVFYLLLYTQELQSATRPSEDFESL